MIYETLSPALFAMICETAQLDADTTANALEVITADFDTDADAIAWIEQTGTFEVGLQCRESYNDAHGIEEEA